MPDYLLVGLFYFMIEQWQDIPGYENYYQCSKDGKVRGLDRIIKHPKGQCLKKGKELRQSISSNGYAMVSLLKDGKQTAFTVHSLIAATFLKGYNPKVNDVNHIDGIKTNNVLSNLEVVSRSENLRHAYSTGLKKATNGTDRYNAKLNEDSVRAIRGANQVSRKALANQYNVSETIIRQVINRRKWAHVE